MEMTISNKADGGGTQSVDRALSLLRLVATQNSQGVRLVDVTRRSGLSKPTVHRLMRALERQGLIVRDGGSELYYLGPEAFVLGTLASERYGIQRAALPHLARLSQASGDTSFLCIRRDWLSVCVHREEGSFPIRTHALQAGDRHPLGVGAGSLAMLAAMPDWEIEEAIGANAEQIKMRYPGFSVETIRNDVAQARERGFTFNPGRLITGSCGVGVAVTNERGECEGALSIAAIDNRLIEPRRSEIAGMLQVEASRLGKRLFRPGGATDFVALPSHRR
jgi:DNA-binding IclR family transcriptional regulator